MELQVVKNVASQSLDVKKLVYLYLLHYAEKYVNWLISRYNFFKFERIYAFDFFICSSFWRFARLTECCLCARARTHTDCLLGG